MTAYIEPPSFGSICDERSEEHLAEMLDEGAEDEYHQGRNWAVLVILCAIIVGWIGGLFLLIWSLVG